MAIKFHIKIKNNKPDFDLVLIPKLSVKYFFIQKNEFQTD